MIFLTPSRLASSVRLGVGMLFACSSLVARADVFGTSSTSSATVASETPIYSNTTIDSNVPAASYRVMSGAVLTGNSANIINVAVNTGGGLVLNGGTVTSDGQSSVSAGEGVSITLNDVNVTGNNNNLALSLVSSDNNGTTAVVNGSRLEGNRGVLIGSGGLLQLSGTTVIGRTDYGLASNGSNVQVSGSNITGQTFGIQLISTVNNRNTLLLSGSQVTGLGGAAIQLGDPNGSTYFPGLADIIISNGTTLKGQDGKLIDLGRDSEANITVIGSTLVGDITAGQNSTLALSLGQGASFTGDVLADASADASLSMTDGALFTGRLQNVTEVSIANGATWQLVEDTIQENLGLSGGIVRLGDANTFRSLSLANLSGSGQFDLHTNFATGQTDFLDITGSSSGSHTLSVASSGSDAEVERIRVAHTADGRASFSLLNGRVDVGTWSYQLVSDNGNTDWYLDGGQKVISPGAASALALYNAAPSVWYGELTTLRSRMGEVRRDSDQASGGWIRSYGNKLNVSTGSGVNYRQLQQGLSFGADTPVAIGDGQWRLGVLGGYSQSALDLQRGTSSDVKSYYIGAYATWLDQPSGYYLDAVTKLNRFRNSADVALSDGSTTKGDYDNSGLGASMEFGRHITLTDGWFAEPYAQLAGLTVQGRDFQLDNGLKVTGDTARSLVGKLGSSVGRTFELGNGRSAQPYVRAALAHEFVKRNDVSVNDNHFNNDLSGSRGELGVGLAVNFGENFQLHADFDYAKGETIEQPWGVNAGLRYLW